MPTREPQTADSHLPLVTLQGYSPAIHTLTVKPFTLGVWPPPRDVLRKQKMHFSFNRGSLWTRCCRYIVAVVVISPVCLFLFSSGCSLSRLLSRRHVENSLCLETGGTEERLCSARSCCVDSTRASV